MLGLIGMVGPSFVSFGTDSKGCGLSEPPRWKILELIDELGKITTVKVKDNLARLTWQVGGKEVTWTEEVIG